MIVHRVSMKTEIEPKGKIDRNECEMENLIAICEINLFEMILHNQSHAFYGVTCVGTVKGPQPKMVIMNGPWIL